MQAARSNDLLARAVRDVLRQGAKRRDALTGIALAMYWAGAPVSVRAAELPVPCVSNACGSTVNFDFSAATVTIGGNTMNINQLTDSAVLNWSQFNISADGIVNFIQPSATATAINRVHHLTDPSRILGTLNANGRVYVLNRNGVLFGNGAKVNVAGLVASSLDLTKIAQENGIAAAAQQGSAAFDTFKDEFGNPLPAGAVRVERGANITTGEGGQVLMFAPEQIVNEGTITTPGGQTLLAAGTPIYLLTSTDDNLRGLWVEVGVGGTVTNGNAQVNSAVQDPSQLVGQIVAERGNVTLAGLAVNQEGRVSATTTVREGGSIRLQARDGGSVDNSDTSNAKLIASNGGTLTLAQNSVTDVLLSTDSSDTTVDANEQPRSQIELQGREVLVLEDASVVAKGGNIDVTARANPPEGNEGVEGNLNDGSRIYIADGATLDVSGADIELAMERNVVSAELRGDELADSPVQRDGALRGQEVFVDIRESGTREDGTTWQGTPLGDVSGQISLIERDVAERNVNGGTVSLASQGDVILAAGSSIDLSGGTITYRDGYINTTQLLGSDGKVYDIADAAPDRVYTSTLSTYTIKDERWGITQTYTGFGNSVGRFEQGYVEGKDAGTLNVLTPRAVLDGDIVGEVTVGRYQRELAQPLEDGATQRDYRQLPLGAQLVFGMEPDSNSSDQVGGDVLLGGDLVLSTLTNETGSVFDPTQDSLPESMTVTTLRSGLFGEDRVARIEIHSNGAVELPADVQLDLPGQGELHIAAGEIDLAGRITAPSGAITAEALVTSNTAAGEVRLDVAGTAVLDVSGGWVNDSALLNEPGAQLAALLIDGGDVELSADNGSLRLAAGSRIDVSGGAWAQSSGSIIAGAAGTIELSASRDSLINEAVSFELGAELLAYGVEHGGSLTLSAPEICVASDADCGSDADGTVALTPEDLIAGGFAAISLTSNERGLTVASGTSIELQQRNRELNGGVLNAATGTRIEDISSVTVLPNHLRAATDLTLRASIKNPAEGVSYNNTNFAGAPGLTIETGAAISADPGARISLRSNSTLLVDGRISAPAGDISLTLDNSLDIGESLQTQGIWLGSNSVLDVRGAVRLEPNEFGQRRGEVLDGGTVQIVAQRGAVIANAGSQIDVSGTSATLDIGNVAGLTAYSTPKVIASDGGTVSITAADAVILSGELNAHAGSGSQSAVGGELQVTLDANQRASGTYGNPPVEARSIVVAQESSPTSIAPGTALPEQLAGQARLAADDIQAAGFGSVTLAARTSAGTADSGAPLRAPGTIEFDGDVNLTVGKELVLDAARITGGGNVNIAAPYVALGHSDTQYQQTIALDADANTGNLQVAGQFLELLGHSTIDGFDTVRLLSEGDLRLRGVEQAGQSTITGGLQTDVDLTLRADQIYAATLSDFELSIDNNPQGVLRIESTGQERATVLSAGSRLTLTAPTIVQAGVLRAPFGTIQLNADQLLLQAGSLTSTSAEGATIPFGSIQAGTDWVYGLENSTLVTGSTLAVPQQTVSLAGEQVQIDSGAVIDVSGGGDLLAYEFIPGTSGNRDVLSIDEEPGRFAIVPALNLQYAPYDPQESAGSSLSVGDTIHISGGVEGLPEGDYVLLPARYALLQGAYIVEAVDGYTDLRAGAVLSQLNGSTIVSGYRTTAGTSYADARSGGFAITSAAVLAGQARYDTALASDFFVAQAAENDTAAPRLPQDAGVLAITAVQQLDINGSLRAAASGEGRGAGVDISAENLRISDTATAAEGEVVVSATSLSQLGAESLLLGGRRSSTAAGTAIDVASQNVTVDAGTSLSAPEILLAAEDTVRVSANATLTASDAIQANDTYLVQGDGAMLRLAGGEQAEIRRDNESGTSGTLILEEGAQLSANGGALALDASLDTRSAADFSLSGGSLSLGASQINLGSAPEDAAGLTLDGAQLSGLNLDELVLVSRSTIDLYGDVVLDVNDVALDAAGLRGLTQDDGGSITAANSILLTNRAGRTAADADLAAGALELNAGEIIVGEGTQRISGYESVALNAADRLRSEEEGGLSVAGNLSMVTPAVVVASGANTVFSADGALRATAPAGGAIAGVQGTELGGALTLTADTVDIATRVEAAAGVVSIVAGEGDLTLSSGAVIDVAGRERDFDGVAVVAPAGDVKLSASGNVLTQAGTLIDVSAAGAGEAGSIAIKAVAGTVSLAGQLAGAAQTSADSGRFDIDVQTIGDLSAINTLLNAGGFLAQREFRQRGAGDLVVVEGDSLRAQQVSLTADEGNIIVNGEIDARGTDGGDVVLSARDAISVNGRILASADSVDGDGGDVALRAETGFVLGSTALIDVSAGAAAGTTGGDVDIRVERGALTAADDGSIDAVVLASGAIRGADQITLEAFKRYTDTDLNLTNGVIESTHTVADNSNLLYQEASVFMESADTIVAALGRTADASFRLVPGIEIQSAGDLSLGNAATDQIVNWDLSKWQFAGVPGVLTLRAGGNLSINGSLSDGFQSANGTLTNNAAYRLSLTPTDSWSYRMVAGADSDSADLMAVDDAIAAGAVSGNFTIEAASGAGASPYRMVRTGNGSIDVSAAGDFILASQNSVLYTAGVASTEGVRIGGTNTGLGGRAYPVDGGDIDIDVQGDIEGAQTDQLVTDWLWRVGTSAAVDPNGFATGWTVNYSRFQQNVGALGGGDVNVSASGDIRNFSASIPSIGRQMGGGTAADSVVDVIGGGNLTVRAGGDIEGGSYYVGLGAGELWSDGDVTTSYYLAANADLYPVLALGDGQWDVVARGSAGIEAVVNPTLLPQGRSQSANEITSFFSTYADTSATSIRAVAGDLLLSNDTAALAAVLDGSMRSADPMNQAMLQIYAPTLQAAALSADLLLNGDTTLFPAAGSTVELFAEEDVSRGNSNSVRLHQSDADPALLASIQAPDVEASSVAVELQEHAATPVHAEDDSLARIVALTGDVTLESSNPNDVSSLLRFATPARIVAAGDIVDLPLIVQHDGANDITSLVAGGDIRYAVSRGSNGIILSNSREINVDGPGTLQLMAGGDVDLQTSGGISTRGNLVNTNLPDGGASVSVLAGVLESQPAYDAAIARYLELGTGYATDLIGYVEAITGEDDLTQEQAAAVFEQLAGYRDDLVAYVAGKSGRQDLTHESALALFRDYTRSEQRVLLERVLFSELTISGTKGATTKDYRRGFAALETLFPGSNPDTEAGETNAYDGDIALYFSRIYTLDGGDISLFAPGGEINVGLATPPVAYGLEKAAELLGLVAQSKGSINALSYRDFAVNESRVFAADGGDITVWSSDGDIDAGRGAKTAISAPPPVITFDPESGAPIVSFPPALAGSGIQTLATSEGVKPGTVYLFAPRGVVNASDAGIVAGNLVIGATAVLGADNIQVSGVAVGVPVDTGGLGASLAGVSAAASSATSAATTSVDAGRNQDEQQTSLADSALSWLEVFVVGLGEDNCKQDDIECLKRQKTD